MFGSYTRVPEVRRRLRTWSKTPRRWVQKDDLGRGPARRIEALGAASTDVVTRSRALKGARHQRDESRAESRRGERLDARESDGFRVLVNGSWLQKSMEAPFASESARQPVR